MTSIKQFPENRHLTPNMNCIRKNAGRLGSRLSGDIGRFFLRLRRNNFSQKYPVGYDIQDPAYRIIPCPGLSRITKRTGVLSASSSSEVTSEVVWVRKNDHLWPKLQLSPCDGSPKWKRALASTEMFRLAQKQLYVALRLWLLRCQVCNPTRARKSWVRRISGVVRTKFRRKCVSVDRNSLMSISWSAKYLRDCFERSLPRCRDIEENFYHTKVTFAVRCCR